MTYQIWSAIIELFLLFSELELDSDAARMSTDAQCIQFTLVTACEGISN